MGDQPRSELLGALQSLYQTRDYSDLVVFARDGSRHLVHRAIVCPRSQFFSDVVKEQRWMDGNEGHIALPDDDPDVVRLLIEYFYLLDYEPVVVLPEDSVSQRDGSDTLSVRTEPGNYGHVYGTSAVSAFGGPNHHSHPHSPFSTVFRPRADSPLTIHAIPSQGFDSFGRSLPRRGASDRGLSGPPEPSPLAAREPHLTLHAKLYAAGDRYGIAGLKVLALDKFKIQLTRHWDSVEFPDAIHTVYTSTPSSDKDMREAVADCIGWHGPLLDKPEIETTVMDIDGLAYELLKRSRRAEPEYMH